MIRQSVSTPRRNNPTGAKNSVTFVEANAPPKAIEGDVPTALNVVEAPFEEAAETATADVPASPGAGSTAETASEQAAAGQDGDTVSLSSKSGKPRACPQGGSPCYGCPSHFCA